MNADDFVGGHSILALERFMDETRHMIIFDVLSWKSPVGEKGERLRLFLSDVGYSGTNFERPQVQKLIELVRANQIDCIIVKDCCAIMGLNQKDLENQGILA